MLDGNLWLMGHKYSYEIEEDDDGGKVDKSPLERRE